MYVACSINLCMQVQDRAFKGIPNHEVIVVDKFITLYINCVFENFGKLFLMD